jgi:iron complex outermembrane receptor protein
MSGLTKRLYCAFCFGTVSYLALSVNFASDVSAEAVALPTVAVDPPKRQPPRRAQPQKAAKKKAAPLVAAPRQAEPVPYLTPTTGVLGAPPPPYAGGQVATGGRLGMLGNRSVMDTPFNQTSYTAKLIQDQQARTLGDVVMNDPSVRLVSNAGSNFDVYHIRGFYSENGDASMNGLYGMVPYYSTAVNYVERVEILKGPSVLLSGMPPAGAVGGSINLVTKQAPDFPITQLTTTYQSKAHFGTLVDLARRFGDNKEWGVRFNGGYRNGKTAFDNQTDEFGNAVLNLDYRGERVRVSADMGYQSDDLSVPQRFITIQPTLAFVPPPPPAGSTYGMPSWSYFRPKSKFAMVQGEVDITDKITAYGALGWHHTGIDFFYVSPTVNNVNGNWHARPFQGRSTWETRAGQAGVRADVDTGPVNHLLNVNLSEVSRPNVDIFSATPLPTDVVHSNLYNPVVLPVPTVGLLAKTLNDRTLSSAGFSDTMSVLNKRIQVTVGTRYQSVATSTTNLLTNAVTSRYDDAVWSPAYAVVVKPLENVSVYANYIEGLQPGTVVGVNFANRGEVFAPYRTTQMEAGVKVDFGRITATVAAFEITKPSVIAIPVTALLNRQALDGEQRNRGVEINTFGELTPTIRLLGGIAFIDGRLTKTQGGINDGHKAPGVADVNLNVGAEWDTWFAPALTVSGRVIYTSSQFINAANTLSIPEWTRLDLGARYTLTSPWNGKPIVVRFAVENVFNAAYWNQSYTSDGVVTVGAPRTFLASSTFNF